MGIQVGGKIFSNNNTLNLPERSGTLADEQYVNEHAGGGGFKEHICLLNQTGTSAPVPTVLKDDLNGLVWSYEGVGTYKAVSVGAFVAGKTVIILGQTGERAKCQRLDEDTIIIATLGDSGTEENAWLVNTSLMIRVYN